ncbi:MAG: nuclear transport factor 2 family protein [Halothiobacillaceae bacterium]
MPRATYTAYQGAEPYFAMVRNALGDLVDGAHFFDVVAEDIAYEVRYDLGWPRVIRGRADLMAQFRGYVGAIRINAVDQVIATRAEGGQVVTLEYEVHGTILSTGVDYDNRFCSIVLIENREIVAWRDYMDSHAAWTALTGGGVQRW